MGWEMNEAFWRVRNTSIKCFRSDSFHDLIPVYMIPVHLLVILLIQVGCNLQHATI